MKYTLELNIKSVEHNTSPVQRERDQKPREVVDLARIVFTGNDLGNVIDQAKGHLDLIGQGQQV